MVRLRSVGEERRSGNGKRVDARRTTRTGRSLSSKLATTRLEEGHSDSLSLPESARTGCAETFSERAIDESARPTLTLARSLPLLISFTVHSCTQHMQAG